MIITVVIELIVRWRKFLKTLRSDCGEVTGELGVFSENDSAPSNKAVDQRLLSHRLDAENDNAGCRERESDEEEEWMSRVCYFVAEESVEQKEKGNKCEVCFVFASLDGK